MELFKKEKHGEQEKIGGKHAINIEIEYQHSI
jgi:hypothetical protein